MNYASNYAIKLLEDEHILITKCLEESNGWVNHPEAYKDRKNKLKQIEIAIKKIKS